MNANEPPDDISEQLEGPVRPGRPAAIELAAALLIVGGVLGIFGVLTTGASQPAGLEALTVLTVVLNVAQIAVGAFIRGGRFWIVAVNFVAVLGFLDLTASGGSPLALMLGLSELAVFVVLLVHRPWFDRRRWTQPPADLPLDAADREPTDDVLLEEEEHDRHRRREQD